MGKIQDDFTHAEVTFKDEEIISEERWNCNEITEYKYGIRKRLDENIDNLLKLRENIGSFGSYRSHVKLSLTIQDLQRICKDIELNGSNEEYWKITKEKDLEEIESRLCPECGSNDIFNADGDWYCDNCGQIDTKGD
jgi:ribosomal protein S27AE